MTLQARQRSNVAIVRLSPAGGGARYWEYYTSSFGGTQWDGRRFRSRDAAIKAARAAGFGRVRVEES